MHRRRKATAGGTKTGLCIRWSSRGKNTEKSTGGKRRPPAVPRHEVSGHVYTVEFERDSARRNAPAAKGDRRRYQDVK